MAAIKLASTATALLLAAAPAWATAGMVCDGLRDKDVAVEMNLPRSAGSPPNWVRVAVPGASFSTLAMDTDATQLAVKQAFDDGRTFDIDLADSGIDEPVIKIRLLFAEEGDMMPEYIGYVQVVGRGVYPISCFEDE